LGVILPPLFLPEIFKGVYNALSLSIFPLAVRDFTSSETLKHSKNGTFNKIYYFLETIKAAKTSQKQAFFIKLLQQLRSSPKSSKIYFYIFITLYIFLILNVKKCVRNP